MWCCKLTIPFPMPPSALASFLPQYPRTPTIDQQLFSLLSLLHAKKQNPHEEWKEKEEEADGNSKEKAKTIRLADTEAAVVFLLFFATVQQRLKKEEERRRSDSFLA